MLEFVWPWAFALLLLLPLLRVAVRPAEKKQLALAVPSIENFRFSTEVDPSWALVSHWIKLILLALAWTSLVAAMARPQWTGDPQPLPTSGRDIMLAVDISGSMNTDDMFIGRDQVTRLTSLKHVVQSFIASRHGDRIGLILFGTQPYVYVPLTFDLATVNLLLQEAPGGIAGSQTAIGDTIGLAVKRLLERPVEHRILVLMTDGSHNEGSLSPADASMLAANSNVRVHTIGIGSPDNGVGFNLLRSLRFRGAPIDEETLQDISSATGGKYFRAKDTDSLINIYNEISQLEPVEQDPETLRPIKSLFHWPLAASLFLFVGLWWLRE